MAYTDKSLLDACKTVITQWDLHFNPPDPVAAPVLAITVEAAEVGGGGNDESMAVELASSYRRVMVEERRLAYEEARKQVLDDQGRQLNATQTLIHSTWEAWFAQIMNGQVSTLTQGKSMCVNLSTLML